jgi:D-threo-aldose 1-dehydrogenase
VDATSCRPLGRRGIEVTQLGLGCAALGNLYTEVSDGEAAQTVALAFESGTRLFDTAPLYGYGLSERRLGDALRPYPRRDYVLSTKVGRLLRPRPGEGEPDYAFAGALPFDPVFDYSPDAVLRSLEDSLQRLGMTRVDVALLHDVGRLTHGDEDHPEIFRTAMEGGYRALDELRAAGSIGAVGMGVNEWEVCIEAMAHADLDCFLLAGRYTLLEQTALDHFLPECQKRGISVIIGGPYNTGILASEPVEGATYDYETVDAELLSRARRIFHVCESHGVPLPSAALQFPLLHPAVCSVIPGARSAREVEQNVGYLGRHIPEELWRDLRSEGLLHPEAPTRQPSGGGPLS